MIWSQAPHFTWKFQLWAGKLLRIWGSIPRSGRSKKIVLFSFHFQILHKKLHIFVFSHFWISCFTNQNSIKTDDRGKNKFRLIRSKCIFKVLFSMTTQQPVCLQRVLAWEKVAFALVKYFLVNSISILRFIDNAFLG